MNIENLSPSDLSNSATFNALSPQEKTSFIESVAKDMTPEKSAFFLETSTPFIESESRKSGMGRVFLEDRVLDTMRGVLPDNFDDLSKEEKVEAIEAARPNLTNKVNEIDPVNKNDTEFFADLQLSQMTREILGEDVSEVGDKVKRFTGGLIQSVFAPFNEEGTQEFLAKNLPTNPKNDTTAASKFTTAAGDFVGQIGQYFAIAALAPETGGASLGLLGLKTVSTGSRIAMGVGFAQNASRKFQENYNLAKGEMGLTDDQALEAGLAGTPGALIDSFGDALLLRGIKLGNAGKAFSAMTATEKAAEIVAKGAAIIKDPKAMNQLLKSTARGFMTEAVSETLGDAATAWGGYATSGHEGFKPKAESLWDSFWIGGVLGGMAGGVLHSGGDLRNQRALKELGNINQEEFVAMAEKAQAQVAQLMDSGNYSGALEAIKTFKGIDNDTLAKMEAKMASDKANGIDPSAVPSGTQNALGGAGGTTAESFIDAALSGNIDINTFSPENVEVARNTAAIHQSAVEGKNVVRGLLSKEQGAGLTLEQTESLLSQQQTNEPTAQKEIPATSVKDGGIAKGSPQTIPAVIEQAEPAAKVETPSGIPAAPIVKAETPVEVPMKERKQASRRSIQEKLISKPDENTGDVTSVEQAPEVVEDPEATAEDIQDLQNQLDEETASIEKAKVEEEAKKEIAPKKKRKSKTQTETNEGIIEPEKELAPDSLKKSILLRIGNMRDLSKYKAALLGDSSNLGKVEILASMLTSELELATAKQAFAINERLDKFAEDQQIISKKDVSEMLSRLDLLARNPAKAEVANKTIGEINSANTGSTLFQGGKSTSIPSINTNSDQFKALPKDAQEQLANLTPNQIQAARKIVQLMKSLGIDGKASNADREMALDIAKAVNLGVMSPEMIQELNGKIPSRAIFHNKVMALRGIAPTVKANVMLQFDVMALNSLKSGTSLQSFWAKMPDVVVVKDTTLNSKEDLRDEVTVSRGGLITNVNLNASQQVKEAANQIPRPITELERSVNQNSTIINVAFAPVPNRVVLTNGYYTAATLIHEVDHNMIVTGTAQSVIESQEGGTELWNEVLLAVGATRGEFWSVASHEKWTNAREAWIRNGKSVSTVFKKVFAALKGIFTNLYANGVLDKHSDPVLERAFEKIYAIDKLPKEELRNKVARENGFEASKMLGHVPAKKLERAQQIANTAKAEKTPEAASKSIAIQASTVVAGKPEFTQPEIEHIQAVVTDSMTQQETTKAEPIYDESENYFNNTNESQATQVIKDDSVESEKAAKSLLSNFISFIKEVYAAGQKEATLYSVDGTPKIMEQAQRYFNSNIDLKRGDLLHVINQIDPKLQIDWMPDEMKAVTRLIMNVSFIGIDGILPALERNPNAQIFDFMADNELPADVAGSVVQSGNNEAFSGKVNEAINTGLQRDARAINPNELAKSKIEDALSGLKLKTVKNRNGEVVYTPESRRMIAERLDSLYPDGWVVKDSGGFAGNGIYTKTGTENSVVESFEKSVIVKAEYIVERYDDGIANPNSQYRVHGYVRNGKLEIVPYATSGRSNTPYLIITESVKMIEGAALKFAQGMTNLKDGDVFGFDVTFTPDGRLEVVEVNPTERSDNGFGGGRSGYLDSPITSLAVAAHIQGRTPPHVLLARAAARSEFAKQVPTQDFKTKVENIYANFKDYGAFVKEMVRNFGDMVLDYVYQVFASLTKGKGKLTNKSNGIVAAIEKSSQVDTKQDLGSTLFQQDNVRSPLADAKTGEPITANVYRATKVPQGQKPRMASRGSFGSGIYLAGNESGAKEYLTFDPADGSNLRTDRRMAEYELTLNNPLVIDASEYNGDPVMLMLKAIGDTSEKSANRVEKDNEDNGGIGKWLQSAIQKAGYDGVITTLKGGRVDAIAYNANQLKEKTNELGSTLFQQDNIGKPKYTYRVEKRAGLVRYIVTSESSITKKMEDQEFDTKEEADAAIEVIKEQTREPDITEIRQMLNLPPKNIDDIDKRISDTIDSLIEEDDDLGSTLFQQDNLRSQQDQENVTRFNELTKDLKSNPSVSDIEEFIRSNPEEFSELASMKKKILIDGGWSKLADTVQSIDLDNFDFNMVGQNENGIAILGQGIYLGSASEEIEQSKDWVNYVYGNRGKLQPRMLINDDNFLDNSKELTQKLLKSVNAVAREIGYADHNDLYDKVKNVSTLRDGRGFIGSVVKSVGRTKARELFVKYGIQGAKEELPDNSIEYAVYDKSAIKSTEPLALDSNGDLITPDKWGNSRLGSTLFQQDNLRSKQDQDYLDAVERGDMDAAQEMVDEYAESKNLKVGHRAAAYKKNVALLPSTTGGLGSAYYAILGGSLDEIKQFNEGLAGPDRNNPDLKFVADRMFLDLGDNPLFVNHPSEISKWADKNGLIPVFESWLEYQMTVNEAYDKFKPKYSRDWNSQTSRIDINDSLEARRAGKLRRETSEDKKPVADNLRSQGYRESDIEKLGLNKDSIETGDSGKLISFLFDRGYLTSVVVDWAAAKEIGMESGDGRTFKEVALANPSQIKSADAVTYENGKPVKLSERFDPKKDNILYQKGEARQDFSKEEVRAIIGMGQAIIQHLHKSGLDKKDIAKIQKFVKTLIDSMNVESGKAKGVSKKTAFNNAKKLISKFQELYAAASPEAAKELKDNALQMSYAVENFGLEGASFNKANNIPNSKKNNPEQAQRVETQKLIQELRGIFKNDRSIGRLINMFKRHIKPQFGTVAGRLAKLMTRGVDNVMSAFNDSNVDLLERFANNVKVYNGMEADITPEFIDEFNKTIDEVESAMFEYMARQYFAYNQAYTEAAGISDEIDAMIETLPRLENESAMDYYNRLVDTVGKIEGMMYSLGLEDAEAMNSGDAGKQSAAEERIKKSRQKRERIAAQRKASLLEKFPTFDDLLAYKREKDGGLLSEQFQLIYKLSYDWILNASPESLSDDKIRQFNTIGLTLLVGGSNTQLLTPYIDYRRGMLLQSWKDTVTAIGDRVKDNKFTRAIYRSAERNGVLQTLMNNFDKGIQAKVENFHVWADRLSKYAPVRSWFDSQFFGDFQKGAFVEAENASKASRDQLHELIKQYNDDTDTTVNANPYIWAMSMLSQYNLGVDPNKSFEAMVTKAYTSIDRSINKSKNSKIASESARNKAAMDYMLDGIDLKSEKAFDQFMEKAFVRIGQGNAKLAEKRLDLMAAMSDMFQVDVANQIFIREVIHGEPFVTVANYLPFKTQNVDGSPEEQSFIDIEPQQERQQSGINVNKKSNDERQLLLGANRMIGMDVFQMVERKLIKNAIDKHSALSLAMFKQMFKYKNVKINNVEHRVPVDPVIKEVFGSGIDVMSQIDIIKSKISEQMVQVFGVTEPPTEIVSGIKKALAFVQSSMLSGIGQVAQQSTSAVVDYSLREQGNVSYMMDSIIYWSQNYDKVRAWMKVNARSIYDRANTQGILENEKNLTRAGTELGSVIDGVGDKLDAIRKAMTISLRYGDKIGAEWIFLAEHRKALEQGGLIPRGAKYDIDDYTNADITARAEGQLARFIGTSSAAGRSWWMSDHKQSYFLLRAISGAFQSSAHNMSSQMISAARNIAALADDNSKEGRAERIAEMRKIGSIMAQQATFTGVRFMVTGMLTYALAGAIKDAWDDEDGAISEAELALEKARKKIYPSKADKERAVTMAERQVADAKAIRRAVINMKQQASGDALMKGMVRDQLSNLHIVNSIGDGFLAKPFMMIPNMILQKSQQDANDVIIGKLKKEKSNALAVGDRKKAASIAEDIVNIQAIEYIPFFYEKKDKSGFGGIIGGALDPIYSAIKEGSEDITRTDKDFLTARAFVPDMITYMAAVGMGQADVNRVARALQRIDDEVSKNRDEADKRAAEAVDKLTNKSKLQPSYYNLSEEQKREKFKKTYLFRELGDEAKPNQSNLKVEVGQKIGGYRVASSQELGLDDYFKGHKDVAGMAYGGGANGSDPKSEKVVVHNPYNKYMADEKRRYYLYVLEAARHEMDKKPVSDYAISENLQKWRESTFEKGNPYREDDKAFRETAVSRALVGDTGGNEKMPMPIEDVPEKEITKYKHLLR